MKRVLVIESCDECKHTYWYLGTTLMCILMNHKDCWQGLKEDEEIPEWCPLPKVKE